MQIFLSQSLIIDFYWRSHRHYAWLYIVVYVVESTFPENEEIDWKYFPVLFKPAYYIFGIVFGILTTFLQAFLPSVKASRVDPIAILRG